MIRRYLIIFCLMAALPAGLVRAQDAPDRSMPGVTHTVAAGESLFVIAQRYGMTVAELKELNGLTGDVIHPGQVLRLDARAGREDVDVPDAETALVASEDDSPADPSQLDDGQLDEKLLAELAPFGVSTYTARPGDTFYSIAAEQGTKAYVLLALNGGRRAPLAAGTSVAVPATGRSAAYEVRPGDTLSRIADREGTTVASLRQANGLTSDLLLVGQTLIIPGASGVAETGAPDTTWFAAGRVTVAPDADSLRHMAGSGRNDSLRQMSGGRPNDSLRQMASGEPYDPTAFTVGHRYLPFGTLLIVENPATGRAAFARVADRGPADVKRLCEVTPALAEEIGVEPGGLVRIRLVE